MAREAGVPLGSTTYHYADLDSLLAAGMGRATARYREEMAEVDAAVARGEDLAHALARAMVAYLETDRGRLVVEYELYLAGLRRPGLRTAAQAWASVLLDLLEPHLGAERAEAVSTVLDGACLRAVVTGRAPQLPALTELLRHVASH